MVKRTKTASSNAPLFYNCNPLCNVYGAMRIRVYYNITQKGVPLDIVFQLVGADWGEFTRLRRLRRVSESQLSDGVALHPQVLGWWTTHSKMCVVAVQLKGHWVIALRSYALFSYV